MYIHNSSGAKNPECSIRFIHAREDACEEPGTINNSRTVIKYIFLFCRAVRGNFHQMESNVGKSST